MKRVSVRNSVQVTKVTLRKYILLSVTFTHSASCLTQSKWYWQSKFNMYLSILTRVQCKCVSSINSKWYSVSQQHSYNMA